MAMIKIRNGSSGFTLIEILVGLAIFSLIITLLVSSKIRQTNQGVTRQQAVEMQQTVRSVILLMTNEIRQAGYNPHYKDYRPGISSANASALRFTLVASNDSVDNNGDGTVDEDGEFETIAYGLQDADGDGDTDITIDYNGSGAQLVAENISSLNFSYFDETGAALALPVADPGEIRSIGISVTVTTDINQLARSSDNTRTLSTVVFPRNLGF